MVVDEKPREQRIILLLELAIDCNQLPHGHDPRILDDIVSPWEFFCDLFYYPLCSWMNNRLWLVGISRTLSLCTQFS